MRTLEPKVELQAVEFLTSTSPYARGERASIDPKRAELMRRRRQVTFLSKDGRRMTDKQVDRVREEEKKRKAKDRAPVDKMERGARSVGKAARKGSADGPERHNPG